MSGLHHPKTFIILFIGTLIIALGILFREQGIRMNLPHFLTSEEEVQEESHILGEQKNSTSDESDISSQSTTHRQASSEYQEQFIADHLALTPANIIWMTNYERVHQGRDPLYNEPLLNNSATAKNEDMHIYGYMNHTFSHDGVSYGFDLFIKKQSYEFLKIGENLAEGDFQNSYELVQAWMKSPEHKKNILDRGFRDIGVSVFRITNPSGTARAVYVQHFGVDQSVCPHTMTNLQNRYHELEEELTLKKAYIGTLDPKQGNSYQKEIDAYNELIQKMDATVQEINIRIERYNQCIAKFL